MLPYAKAILESIGLEWRLPGHGKAYDDCGEWLVRGCLHSDEHSQSELFSDSIGMAYLEFHKRSCRRPDCPICYEKWAGFEAGKIEYKIKHAWKFGKPIHVALSVPEKDALNLPFEKIRAKSYSVAKSRGIIGGVSIFHPFRQKCARCGHHPIESWDHSCPECGFEVFAWYFSPHFHVIGYGWVRAVAEGFKKDGWIVHNILDGDRERSVFRTALYQLSHCGISDHFAPITWFGALSSAGKNRFVVPPMPKRDHLCPGCGRELVSLRYSGVLADLVAGQNESEPGGGVWLDPLGWSEKKKVRFSYGES